ncbi:MAG: 2-hydroxychromene-2-carboxylate isomerase [Alphaproteobacteria bacterium]|nr:2-hydroxychromene-2-carboxylate isomerase [Alphaproteobacteria bacterium]
MSDKDEDGEKKPIYFYFDFSSPYSYFAALRINEIAKLYGRKVIWKPILLGAVFQETGNRPLTDQGLKARYTLLDLARQARMQDVPFKMPEPFPFMSTHHARAFYWIADQDEKKAKQFARSLFKKIFGKGKPLYKPAQVVEVAEAKGIDGKALAEALTTDAVKARLRKEVEEALAKGVCGSPYFIVDGEPFWGNDRLDHIERWLSTGGW